LALSRADQAVRAKKYAEAARLFDEFVSGFPTDSRREFALSASGKASELAGKYPEAISRYSDLIGGFPSSGYASEARLRLPQLYIYSGDYEKALEAARGASSGLRDATAKANLKLSEGKAQYLLGNYQQAAEAFLAAWRGLGGERKDEAASGLYASFARLDQIQLNDFARQGAQNFPGPEAVWFMAWLSHSSGDQNSFLAQAQYFKTYFPSHPWAASLDSMAANLSAPGSASPPGADFDPRAVAAGPVLAASQPTGSAGIAPLSQSHTVAALLPLTGSRASGFAIQALAGLRLAASRSGGKLAIAEYDTQGQPANAVSLTSQIAQDPGVIAIVGPINSDEALAAAQTAQQLGVPLIALSTRIGLANSRPYVFRVFLTYEAQARAVARWAVRDRGHKTLGALYPDDTYGRTMLRYFEDEAQALGAQVTAKQPYQSPGGNYAEAASRITGGAGGARGVPASYQAPTSFTSLYIPESPSAVSQILPYLAWNDVTKMELLGTSMWAAPEFAQASGRYLEGSVIPAAFSPLSQRPEAKAFLESYRAVAGQDPQLFAVYGHDAGLAVLAALSAGAQDRRGLPDALRGLPPIPGASGPFRFDYEGEYLVSPVLLTVGGSEFKLLRDAQAY
jgi:ABC-type branched-subunit amino acid transport system substrate-binding protein/TolA-binding protein